MGLAKLKNVILYNYSHFEQQISKAVAPHAQHVRPLPGQRVQRRDDQVGLVNGQPGKQYGRVRCADAQSEQQRDPGYNAHGTGVRVDGVKSYTNENSIMVELNRVSGVTATVIIFIWWLN